MIRFRSNQVLSNSTGVLCSSTSKINKISVADYNPRYKSINSQMVVGKSKIEGDEFNDLVFAIRNIKKFNSDLQSKMLNC